MRVGHPQALRNMIHCFLPVFDVSDLVETLLNGRASKFVSYSSLSGSAKFNFQPAKLKYFQVLSRVVTMRQFYFRYWIKILIL